MLAIFYEVHQNKSEIAQRQLEEAVRRGTKYLAIATEPDRVNLIAAINNLAVSHARNNRVSKATRLWGQADQVSEHKIPDEIKHNVAKLNRIAGKQGTGISGNRSEKRSIQNLASEISANGSESGWEFICPVDWEGNPRNNIDFVLTKFSTINGNVINDTRCVVCDGTTAVRCTNKLCKNGAVKIKIWGDKILTYPNGKKVNLGPEVKGFKHEKCKYCGGSALLPCRCCAQGHQKN